MPRPPGGIRAATLFSICGALLLVAGAAIAIVRAGDYSLNSLVTAGFYLIVALIVIPVALRLRTGSATARSVIVTWSLILVLAMLTLMRVLEWQAYAGIAFGLVTLIALSLPSSRAFIRPRRIFDEEHDDSA